jgi:nucleotide-binding universal stress UspA family protein
MHVLIATDGSDVSIDAARRGCEMLAGANQVTLLTVTSDDYAGDDAGGIEGPVLSAAEAANLQQQERADARDELARTAAALSSTSVTELIEAGAPVDVICRTAEKIGADVIVVGSHGRTGLGRLFLGSVSEHVVRHAPCPVLVVKSSEPDD